MQGNLLKNLQKNQSTEILKIWEVNSMLQYVRFFDIESVDGNHKT